MTGELLKSYYLESTLEAGCDEAGRGCLAGPVFAAAVILPVGFDNNLLNDSKKVSPLNREKLRIIIEKEAIAYAVSSCSNQEIDTINILNASILAMHRALDQLQVKPGHIIVDGNRFKPYSNIKHKCIIKGDSKFKSIAAASILAKTYRDEFMQKVHVEFPYYGWTENKGYPTLAHREAIQKFGLCKLHRKTFNSGYNQLKLFN